jgi:hypothetical protein
MITQTDVDNLEAAIQLLHLGKSVGSFSSADKSVQFNLQKATDAEEWLERLKATVAMAAGTFSPRTYAKQGGRGI